MKAITLSCESTEDLRRGLNAALAGGYKPTVGIAFLSVKQDRKALTELLRIAGIDCIGATTCGEFINDFQTEGGCVLMLLDINRDAYTILYEEIGMEGVAGATERLARRALQRFKKPAIILCTTSLTQAGDFIDGEEIVASLEKVTGPGVSLFGGMAGDDATFSGTYVFTCDHSGDKALAALILDEEKISIAGMAISGWKPLGISRTVTRSEGRNIYTIDDQPAPEMYLRYLGRELNPGEDKYTVYQSIGVYYPFQVERPSRVPAMVTPMMINEEQTALVCEAPIPEGNQIRFSMPPDFDIVETVLEKAEEVKRENMDSADALLIFSCAGRLSAMGPFANMENQGLADLWQAPMAGFYSYGEYGRAINGRQEFHSTTCCWVVLKEK